MKMIYKKELPIYVGKRLKERRKKLGITLIELADQLGISYQQIQKYETAKNGISAETLYSIALIFNVEINYFFEGFHKYMKRYDSLNGKILRDPLQDSINILLIEEDPEEEAVIREALEAGKGKKSVYSAHQPMQAMKLLRYPPTTVEFNKPDIIMLSLDFPNKEGQWLLKDIKRDRELGSIPIIALSRDKQEEEILSAYRNFASGFIYKSPNKTELQQSVKGAFSYWTSVIVPLSS